jgi:hypothetical protein
LSDIQLSFQNKAEESEGNGAFVEEGAKTVADYLELSQDMSEGEFVRTFSLPVLIEKVGIFPHEDEDTSLLSGTVIVPEQSDLWESEGESDDQDIRDARVFLLQKKAGSMGPNIFLGRAPTNDIVLAEVSVSKSHAQVTHIADTGRYQIADMFSSNGTYINDEKIHPFEEHQINDYDQISLGPHYHLIYHSPRGFNELLTSLRV